MTSTVEIPLEEATLRALRHGGDPIGLAALAAIQSRPPTASKTETVDVEPDIASAPVPGREAVVIETDHRTETTERLEPAPDAADPATESPLTMSDTDPPTVAPPAGTLLPVSQPAPGAMTRGGDVYIAHYYARLPADSNQNPYTRLGDPAAHG